MDKIINVFKIILIILLLLFVSFSVVKIVDIFKEEPSNEIPVENVEIDPVDIYF